MRSRCKILEFTQFNVKCSPSSRLRWVDNRVWLCGKPLHAISNPRIKCLPPSSWNKSTTEYGLYEKLYKASTDYIHASPAKRLTIFEVELRSEWALREKPLRLPIHATPNPRRKTYNLKGQDESKHQCKCCAERAVPKCHRTKCLHPSRLKRE
jgi:hypothetical protein